MLNPKEFYDLLVENDLEYFFGVPDSTLKYFCSYIDEYAQGHMICANEGNAIANAMGYHLATNKVPVVYMQNSGFGNALNPILSMASKEIYQIPMLIIVGWRGEPGIKDEPQHTHQGKVLLPSLGAMDLDYDILPTKIESAHKLMNQVLHKIRTESKPYFLIIKKGTFEEYFPKEVSSCSQLNRLEVIKRILETFPHDKYIASTGFISRELYQLREQMGQGHEKDFLSIGSMGHTSQIAYAYAKHSGKKVICLDGDGSFLMHMGGTTAIQHYQNDNIIHIVLNNGCHLSVGGQPTIAQNIKLEKIAKECGFAQSYSVTTKEKLESILEKVKNETGPVFIDIKVSNESINDLMRPTLTPQEMKKLFMSEK